MRGQDATVHRDVAPVTKLASSRARKTIRDALSSRLQTLLGDAGRDFGGAVRDLFILARLEHLSLPCRRCRAKILPAPIHKGEYENSFRLPVRPEGIAIYENVLARAQHPSPACRT